MFLILLPVFLLILCLLFLVKKFPDYFPQKIVFGFKILSSLILDVMLIYLLFFSLNFSLADTFIKNGIKCYTVQVSYRAPASATDICSPVLNNISPIHFLVAALIIIGLLIVFNRAILRKKSDLNKILFNDVALLKEGGIRKGFLATVITIAVILAVVGFIYLSNL